MLTENELIKISEICKDKSHIRFTIGTYHDGKIDRYLFGSDGIELPFEKHVYEIGSITKTFTSTLIAKAIAEKKLFLEDTLNHFLSDLPQDRVYPIIRRLVTHTAGYPTDDEWIRPEELDLFEKDFAFNPYDTVDMERLTEIIISRIVEDKDYDMAYSNIGVSVMDSVLESIYHKDYDILLQELLDEIGLSDTYLGDQKVNGNLLCGFTDDNVNTGHFYWKKAGKIKAAGYLFSTADDLLKYAAYLMDEKNTYLKPCFTKQNCIGPDMGICWQLKPDSGFAWHNGGTRSFHSFLCMDTIHKNAVSILVNYESGNIEQLGIDILKCLKKDMDTVI